MSAKTYSAGTIFLQVVPSYRDFMETLQKDSRELSREAGKALFDNEEWDKAAQRAGSRAGKSFVDSMGKEGGKAADALGGAMEQGAEKSGEKAAKKYHGAFRTELKQGLAATQRELKALKIDVDVDDAEAKAEIKAIMAEIKALSKTAANVKVKIDGDAAIARLKALETRLGALRNDADIDLDFNIAAAEGGINRFAKKLQALKEAAEVALEVDTTLADRKIGAFERNLKKRVTAALDAMGDKAGRTAAEVVAKLEMIRDAEINIDMDAGVVVAQIAELEAELVRLSTDTVDIDVDADISAAVAELMSVSALAKVVSGDDVDIDVDVDTAAAIGKLAALRAMLKGTGADSGTSAQAFRTFNAAVLAGVTLGPALIPILAGIAGGLVAIGPAAIGAASGLGIAIVGFTGLSAAIKGLGDAQKNSAKDSAAHARSVRNAAEAVSDAQRNLSRAREDAAESASDSARSVARAEQDAARSIKDALKQQEDAERSLAAAKRDSRQAELDLIEARKLARQEIDDLNDSLRDGKLAERQAQIDLFEAQVAYDSTIADPGATNLEKEQASINLARAEASLSDIREGLTENGKKKAKIDKEGVAGTDVVQNAQDALTAALERQRDAQLAVGEAAQAVNRARVDGAEAVADAVRAQRRTEENSAEAISDAQRNLTRAQQDYQDALVKTSTSVDTVREAMSKLGPEGRAFARYIYGLRDGFYALRAIIQAGLLPGVRDGLETVFNRYSTSFKRFAGRMGREMGDAFRQFGKWLTNKDMSAFFGMIEKTAPKFVRMFTKTTLNWLQTFANIMRAAAPLGMKLGEGLLRISEGVLKWTKSKRGQEMMSKFFGYVEKVGPKVWDFFVQLVGAFVKLGEALAPYAGAILVGITGFLRMIADMDPNTLGLIVMGLIGVAFAVQMASLAMTLITGAAAIFASTVGLVILIAAGIIFALFILYTRSETARDIMNNAFRAIGRVASWLWDNVLRPVFGFIGDAFRVLGRWIRWVWKNVWQPTFTAIGDAALWVWDNILRPVFGFIARAWDTLARAVRWTWRNIMWPILDLVGTVVRRLWEEFVEPAFDEMGGAWEALGLVFRTIWRTFIRPIFDAFMDIVGNQIVDAFQGAVDAIGGIWGGLVDIISAPIRFVIETVLNNGLIAAFNQVARFVGSDPMGEIPVPSFAQRYDKSGGTNYAGAGKGKGAPMGFADGGIYPGYTPGRDIGYIGISGGEAIMRPEWTRAVGPGFVNQMNAIARTAGIDGVRKAMGYAGGFANGGVVDYNKYAYDGVTLNGRTLKMLLAAEKLIGTRFDLTQGSYSTSVSQSGGTHDGGGAFDAWSPFTAAAINALRRVGFAAWRRYPYQGDWDSHIHGIALGDMQASSAAMSQMAAFRAGGDGLGGSDYEARPAIDYSLLAGIDISKASVGAVGSGPSLPGWLKAVVGTPIKWVMGKVMDGIGAVTDRFGSSPLLGLVTAVPKMLVDGVGAKIASWFGDGDAQGNAAADGDMGGYWRGGVVPDNGTMMYDSGGYLPPGLTTVLNMTGRPEPVFTAEQFDQMGGGGGAGIHYEPHFNESDLTADDVTNDLMFALWSIDHGGKYAGRRP